MRLPYKNETVFAGYVGNVPELRYLPTGDATVSLRIVAKQSWQVDGEWRTHDEWATAVFYRALAQQVIDQGITKGRFVHVEGRRHTRRWGADQGKPKVAHEIIVSDWHEVALPAGASQAEVEPAEPAEKPTSAKAPAAPKPGKAPPRTLPPTSATEGFA